jgi:hypothetical protein
MEPRASYMLSKGCTTELHPPAWGRTLHIKGLSIFFRAQLKRLPHHTKL